MRRLPLATALLATVLTLTAGCSGAEKREEEIALRVNATVAAWPTQTPYPTLTPEPTYTPLPTYTPYPTYTPAPANTPGPTPDVLRPEASGPREELLDRLAGMMWICARNLPEFREDFVEGITSTGLTEDVALAILEDEQNFRAAVRELAEDEDWLGNPREMAALIPVMEFECGTDYPE